MIIIRMLKIMSGKPSYYYYVTTDVGQIDI